MKTKEQPAMYYYHLWFDDSDPLGLICWQVNDKGFSEYRLWDCQRIEDWPESVTCYVEGEHPEDYLIVSLLWEAVSERAKRVFEENGIEGVQFLPAQVVHRKTQEQIGTYWVLNVLRAVEALDWERTRWLYPEKKWTHEHPISNAVKEVFRIEAVRGVDIFRLKAKDQIGVIYVSLRLKQCLERAGATSGFKFMPVPVY